MKKVIPFLTLLTLFIGCKRQNERINSLKPNYFQNLYTQEILNRSEFNDFVDSLHKAYFDSVKGACYITIHEKDIIPKGDSIIEPFLYDIRVGTEYLIRSKEYKKIGMNIPLKKFRTIFGDSIQIGGRQMKPTLINLWFIKCGGCIAEIPALNRLSEKYADKVNFIAMNFDNEKDVRKFIKKTPFNFTHIASFDWNRDETSLRPYIKTIESYPYPENIFIDKNGVIRYVEGIIAIRENVDFEIKHFEMILNKLINE